MYENAKPKLEEIRINFDENKSVNHAENETPNLFGSQILDFPQTKQNEETVEESQNNIGDDLPFTDKENFRHLEDLKKLNESDYLDEIENRPAIDRLNKK